VTLDIWETTSKGPYLLGDNLGVMLLGSCKFIDSNQTFDLTGNGKWHGCSLIQESCTLCCAPWAAFLASSISEMLCLFTYFDVLRLCLSVDFVAEQHATTPFLI